MNTNVLVSQTGRGNGVAKLREVWKHVQNKVFAVGNSCENNKEKEKRQAEFYMREKCMLRKDEKTHWLWYQWNTSLRCIC